MAKAELKVVDRPKPGALTSQHILPAQSSRTTWVVTPPHGCLAEDLLEPSYWKHLIREYDIKPNDRIDATGEDGTWFAEYLVLHVSRQALTVKLQCLEKYALQDLQVQVSADLRFGVKWHGPAHKWIVFRKEDKHTVKHGFDTEHDANMWLRAEINHLT